MDVRIKRNREILTMLRRRNRLTVFEDPKVIKKAIKFLFPFWQKLLHKKEIMKIYSKINKKLQEKIDHEGFSYISKGYKASYADLGVELRIQAPYIIVSYTRNIRRTQVLKYTKYLNAAIIEFAELAYQSISFPQSYGGKIFINDVIRQRRGWKKESGTKEEENDNRNA